MNPDQKSKIQVGWPVDAEIKVYAHDIFVHGGRIHSSEMREFFFRTEEELQSWLALYGKRAQGDGPAIVSLSVSDWLYSKKRNLRCLESVEFRNPSYDPSKVKSKFEAWNRSQ